MRKGIFAFKDKYKSIDPVVVQDLFINDWAF